MKECIKLVEVTVDQCSSSLYAFIIEQVCFFKRHANQVETLIEKSTETRKSRNTVFSGGKYPLSLIIEVLRTSQLYYFDEDIKILYDKLLVYLRESYCQSGFNYFDKPLLPNDLDTVSIVTRVLGQKYPDVFMNYHEMIERNQISRGLVPTWLDTKDHSKWLAGNQQYHIDVLLNFWITEFQLGNPVDPSILLNIVRNDGLRNYWYLPPTYTAFMYTRLVRLMGLIEENDFRKPLIEFLSKMNDGTFHFLKESNSCSYERVQDLVQKQKVFNSLGIAMLHMIESSLDCKGKFSKYQLIKQTEWEVPLYWSLGFETFASEAVTRAIILLCLLENSSFEKVFNQNLNPYIDIEYAKHR